MDTALSEFKESLVGAAAVVASIDANAAAALSDPQVRALNAYQSCGVVVLLSGYFEEFLRQLVQGYCTEIAQRGIAFSALPQGMRDRHYEQGGRVLSDLSRAWRTKRASVFKPRPPEQVTRRLDSGTYPLGGVPHLLWEAFVEVGENPSAGTVKLTLKNLGFDDPWPTIASHVADQSTWGESRITIMLGDFHETRNNCAHTGRVDPVPPVGKLRDFIEMFEVLGDALVATLRARLPGMMPLASARRFLPAREAALALINALTNRAAGQSSRRRRAVIPSKIWAGGSRPLP